MLVLFTGHSEASPSLSLTLGDKEYHAVLDDNVTVRDIVKHLPLTLDMQRYAGHEYCSDLSFRPEAEQGRTSSLKAGHLYYWEGGNTFVINYKDTDISPYKDVHLGAFSEDISAELMKSEEHINITIKEAE